MAQCCCSKCIQSIGQFICYIFCCKCCCCCCRRQKEEKSENKQNIELQNTSNPQLNFVGDDDGSIYNGSSTYDNQSVIKHQTYPDSGVYMSQSSLYSGSVVENQNEMKLEISCEIKGTLEVGGIPQPIKGVLSIIPDEDKKQTTPTQKSIYAINPGITKNVTLGSKNSRSESLNKKQNRNSRTPFPLPRTKESSINDSIINIKKVIKEENNTSRGNNDDYYLEPCPPLPLKKHNSTDNVNSYSHIYGNVSYNHTSNNTNSAESVHWSKTDSITSEKVTTQNRHPNKLQNNTHEDNAAYQDDNIYEDIIPSYQEPYSGINYKHNGTIDYEIYL